MLTYTRSGYVLTLSHTTAADPALKESCCLLQGVGRDF